MLFGSTFIKEVDMRIVFLLTVILVVIVSVAAAADPTVTPSAEEQVLFDDFNYTATDDPALSGNGWIVRTVEGWPGTPGAIWREENVTFVDDADEEGNRLMQMTSSADGENTYQTQVCQGRKFYEGTYASRVHFSDDPATGPDGDNIVQTFYLISPQKEAMDPDYSELDFEYLPNGGWGVRDSVLHTTTWETFQLEPWIADNATDADETSYDGWHTLVVQIFDGEANYFVDGEPFATHDDKFYPEVPMSINYNLWFINGGQINDKELREYVEHVDWTYFAGNVALSPEEVETNVAALREDAVTFTDSVPEWEPPLESPCNF
jgi:hypothetical protein